MQAVRPFHAIASFTVLAACLAALVVPVWPLASPASAQSVDWTHQFGTSAFGTTTRATGTAVDGSGIYVAGFTDGSTGGLYALVRKYDAGGAELWTHQFRAATGGTLAAGVAVDGSGVYVVGYTHGALPGQTSAGEADAFVRKYDVNGNELWTRQFGSGRTDDAVAVAVAGGSIYVLGSMQDPLSLPFVRKYDANGTELWTLRPADRSPRGLAADASGVYVVGSVGDADAFVRRYDAGGTELWTRQFGTATYDLPTGAGQTRAASTSGVSRTSTSGVSRAVRPKIGCSRTPSSPSSPPMPYRPPPPRSRPR